MNDKREWKIEKGSEFLNIFFSFYRSVGILNFFIHYLGYFFSFFARESKQIVLNIELLQKPIEHYQFFHKFLFEPSFLF